MAGESAHFGLRNRAPTPAVRPFELPQRLQPFRERAMAGLAEPFRGISRGGEIVPGLFPIEQTGISLAPLVEAARNFLGSLSAEQREAACFVLDDEAWRMWSNIHPWVMRHGVCLAQLGTDQRGAALGLLRHSMSDTGYRSARDIMRLNQHALEITGKPEEYSEWFYWVSIFGDPSPDRPWGWQIDGHHLNINCCVLGDQLVMTPAFMGSEPVLARFGKYAGTRVFAAEEEQGHALMRSLSADERRRATVGKDLPSELLTAAFRDNARIDAVGIRYGDLPPESRELLEALLGVYTGRLRPGHAEVRYAEARRHLGDTLFAWIGPFDDTSPFYYRTLSPVILIEFDHQSGIVYDNDVPSRDHIHTVVRTPNGNDYGKDLLRQHYLRDDHVHGRTGHLHHRHHHRHRGRAA
jgi:Protein of unknown function (DUF3500)